MEWYNDPTYRRMCDKAKKIQDLWKPQVGDYYASFTINERAFHSITIITKLNGNQFGINEGWPKAWLPTQSQLQKMVLKDNRGNFKYIRVREIMNNGFIEFMNDFKYGDRFCNSMEQLWLAFVMKENFNKRWNGTDWVKA